MLLPLDTESSGGLWSWGSASTFGLRIQNFARRSALKKWQMWSKREDNSQRRAQLNIQVSWGQGAEEIITLGYTMQCSDMATKFHNTCTVALGFHVTSLCNILLRGFRVWFLFGTQCGYVLLRHLWTDSSALGFVVQQWPNFRSVASTLVTCKGLASAVGLFIV